MITRRPAAYQDADFVFEVKKDALRPYYDPLSNWEDGDKRELFRLAFEPRETSIIQLDGQDIGVLVLVETPAMLALSEIYVLTAYQNRGIGTSIIQDILAEADARQVPVTLHVMKANPACELYWRLGFATTQESDDFYEMIRMPSRPDG
ncbi:MAG TPA: GNAT family N-acetyltransferase [Aggregatilineales bacterium]|nr:GNAT family N-acetyltransferase [Aggregatilineales bacterium]